MWIHIVIFIMIFGTAIAWKAGWIPLDGIVDAKSRRLFFLTAAAGNILGMAVTAGSGSGMVYSSGLRLEKEETGAREERFLVRIDGEEAGSVSVQVPEKESDVPEEEPEAALSKEEEQELKIREILEQYNQEKNSKDYYYLPAEWKGKKFQWETPADNSGSLLSALAFAAAIVLMLKKAREEQEQKVKRSEQLLMDYPALVMKFTLLVQAGMTERKAFQKISLDYRRGHTGKARFAYEEILAACNEMESGVSEAEAYRRFGERCAQIKYKTFATLLIQNLQKGSRRMSDMLEKESLEAWDERKRKARVLGEAAATKLLLPMAMMLMVVMAVIMIPAFLSFYT
ncbi:MAG TPA: type II secretion system F family protein [Candidatus Blautia faecigallinarum]|uniref:Type II secretion system F family protein n=1 Tax=Candidatus Blautia faecigallinarum TaxID=2838488 RepID=A0A9D2ITC3_9FIRM|nr:type II secretion system F family protein [Candidatus Blautia faecigallinarum]